MPSTHNAQRRIKPNMLAVAALAYALGNISNPQHQLMAGNVPRFDDSSVTVHALARSERDKIK